MIFSFKCVAAHPQPRDWVADELERISKMVREGITAGDTNMVDETGATCFHGKWETKPENAA